MHLTQYLPAWLASSELWTLVGFVCLGALVQHLLDKRQERVDLIEMKLARLERERGTE